MSESIPPLPPGLDPEVGYWLEMAEANACLDQYTAAGEAEGDPVGARAIRIGEVVAFAITALDFGFFNRTIGLGIGVAATRDDVVAAAAFYRDLGLRQSALQLAPGATPPDLVGWVEREGYRVGSRWVKLWHDLRSIDEPRADRRIVRIGSDGREAFGDVCMTAFEMPQAVRPIATSVVGRPGWTHYLGYEGDTPVSCAAMRLDSGVAWLGFGATLPGSRGRGWQTAMFLRRLADARDAGCRLAVTETGEETTADPVNHSYRNMLRTGFRLGYARRNWRSA